MLNRYIIHSHKTGNKWHTKCHEGPRLSNEIRNGLKTVSFKLNLMLCQL